MNVSFEDAVADLLVEHVRGCRGVALVLAYGSFARGTQLPDSDLDVLFVVDEPECARLAVSFVLAGRPCDFWPVGWSFLEAIAAGHGGRPWGMAASLIADSTVLYARSDTDVQRLDTLKDRVRRFVASDDEVTTIVEQAYQMTLRSLGQMHLAVARDDVSGSRIAAWQIVSECLNVLAIADRTYFTDSASAHVNQAAALASAPRDVVALCDAVTDPPSPRVGAKAADQLVAVIADALVRDAQSPQRSPQDVFHNAYAEVHEHCLKLERACDDKDHRKASSEAHAIMNEVAALVHDLSVGGPAHPITPADVAVAQITDAGLPDLIDLSCSDDLDALAAGAREFDRRFRGWLQSRGVDTHVLDDLEDLEMLLASITADRC